MDATGQHECLQNRYSKTNRLHLLCLYTVHAYNITLEEYKHSMGMIVRQHNEKMIGNKHRYFTIVAVIIKGHNDQTALQLIA